LIGPEVPEEELIWQDPVPALNHGVVDQKDIKFLKEEILATGLSVSSLISTAWASASTFRKTDFRGGANGARIRLEPMKNWEVNNPKQLSSVLAALEKIQQQFNANQSGSNRISLADLIVLAGCAAVEKAAKDAGTSVEVPFVPGRMDALAEQTDVDNIAVLEPMVDGFRNYRKGNYAVETERMLIDRAQLLDLSAPEMTVLVGGLRVLGANFDGSKHGVFTNKVGILTNEFFVNLLDINSKWSPVDDEKEVFEARDTKTGNVKWTATRSDLVFGSNPQLRSLATVYAAEGGQVRFVKQFVDAWHKVMMLDRFEMQNELYRS
jgi:catalase-peroxidase